MRQQKALVLKFQKMCFHLFMLCFPHHSKSEGRFCAGKRRFWTQFWALFIRIFFRNTPEEWCAQIWPLVIGDPEYSSPKIGVCAMALGERY